MDALATTAQELRLRPEDLPLERMRIAGIGFVAVLLLFQYLVPARGQQPDTNVYVLDFSKQAFLKDIFDAGLRPVRLGTALHECFVENKYLRFRITGGYEASIFAETCHFKAPNSKQALNQVKGESPKLDLKETRAWMLPICRAFERPEHELDDFLEKVSNGHRKFGHFETDAEGFDVSTATTARESGQPTMGVSLRWSGDPQRPVRIILGIGWARPQRELDFPPYPLKPPPGYEQFSMEPPSPPYVAEWIRNGEPAPPDVESRLGREGIQRLRDEYAAKQGVINVPLQSRPLTSPPPSSPAIAEPSPKATASTPWPKWPLITALLAAVFGWILWQRMQVRR